MADDDVEISEEALDAERLAKLTDREKRVESFMRSGKTIDAAKASLEDPPLASKNKDIKDRNAANVLKTIVAVGAKDADLTAFLEGLDADLADNLMKYLYKGLSKPDNAGLLFKIHAALVEKWGTGCIVRAITDRKTA